MALLSQLLMVVFPLSSTFTLIIWLLLTLRFKNTWLCRKTSLDYNKLHTQASLCESVALMEPFVTFYSLPVKEKVMACCLFINTVVPSGAIPSGDHRSFQHTTVLLTQRGFFINALKFSHFSMYIAILAVLCVCL